MLELVVVVGSGSCIVVVVLFECPLIAVALLFPAARRGCSVLEEYRYSINH